MKNNYIFQIPYLRNSTAYDHDFLYTCVKYLQVFFFFFHFFQIFIFGIVWGGGEGEVKGQKITQIKK